MRSPRKRDLQPSGKIRTTRLDGPHTTKRRTLFRRAGLVDLSRPRIRRWRPFIDSHEFCRCCGAAVLWPSPRRLHRRNSRSPSPIRPPIPIAVTCSMAASFTPAGSAAHVRFLLVTGVDALGIGEDADGHGARGSYAPSSAAAVGHCAGRRSSPPAAPRPHRLRQVEAGDSAVSSRRPERSSASTCRRQPRAVEPARIAVFEFVAVLDRHRKRSLVPPITQSS